MIRGLLQKGSDRDKPSLSSTATAAIDSAKAPLPLDAPAIASTSSTASSSATESVGDRNTTSRRSRPTSGSSDDIVTTATSASGFFRDSTVPLAKSIKSAGKIFRSTVSELGGIGNNTSSTAEPHSQHNHQSNNNHRHGHHPQHSSQTHTHTHAHPHAFERHTSMPTSPPEQQLARAGKKCSLCGKSFNPLRRRYFCRVCTIEVCSNCSLKRKVDSSLEGAIAIRICMACKMNASAHGGHSSNNATLQSDYYDRAFSVATTSLYGDNHSDDASIDDLADRTSAASFVSAAAAPAPHSSRADALLSASSASTASTRPYFSSASSTTSVTTPSSTTNKIKTPSGAVVASSLRRTSSSASNQSSAANNNNPLSATASHARSRRDSFGSVATAATPAECQMCMNEACGPMLALAEVQYPALEVRGYADRFVRARSLDNELARLESVRRLRRALIDAPPTTAPTTQRIAQLCSMAAIATQSRIAVVSLLDRDEFVSLSDVGLPSDAAPCSRVLSLAAHTCRNGAPLVCSDLSADVRFSGNPWRRDTLRVRFYAGIPLTLANGHTIGAIEVFDKHARFACMDVVTQLQAVVRGLLKTLEQVLASAAPDAVAVAASPLPVPTVRVVESSASNNNNNDDASIAQAIAQLERTTSYSELKLPPASSRSPVRRAPAPVAPPSPVMLTSPVATAAPAPAPTAPPASAGPTENEMELRLMELLSQTTSTQEQLRNQQGHMVHAITSHSKQITELAKQLERMESTLNAKLDAVPSTTKAEVTGRTAIAAGDAVGASRDETPEVTVP